MTFDETLELDERLCRVISKDSQEDLNRRNKQGLLEALCMEMYRLGIRRLNIFSHRKRFPSDLRNSATK